MTEIDVWEVTLDRFPSSQALRAVLAHYLDEEPERIEFQTGSYGKPALADPDVGLRFNLSHSGALALIAVTSWNEVGIDIEERRADRDFLRLAELGLGSSDAAKVRDSPPDHRADVFYSAWVRHEAVVKCLGIGLGRPLPELPPVSVCELDAGAEHTAALAVAAPGVPPVRRRILSPD